MEAESITCLITGTAEIANSWRNRIVPYDLKLE